MAMAKALKGRTAVETAELSGLVAAARDAMAARGKAELGGKTVLDSLDAIAAALDGLTDPDAAADAAPRAARAALEAFRDRPATVGRARIFAEKSRGMDDPGMLAMALIVEALSGRGFWLRKSFVRSDFGLLKNSLGSFCSTIWPWSMKITRFATAWAKPISWVTQIIVIPSAASSIIVSSTSLIISGSSAEVGSSKSMIFGRMQSARAIATRCCWPPESWPGYFVRLLGDLDLVQEVHRGLLGLPLRGLADPDRGEGAVLEDGEVREEVEVLEHHPDLGAHLVDVLEVGGELDAVDDDLGPSGAPRGG